MYNPLEDSVPDDPIQCVHALARDLAYGAVHGYWPSELTVDEDIIGLVGTPPQRQVVKETWYDPVGKARLGLVEKKWGYKNDSLLPSHHILISFMYIEIVKEGGFGRTCRLTSKAFALLEQSLARVFISYRRDQSSLLALLVLARLKAIGINPFFDIQDIGPGDKWHAHIREQIEQSDHLICLIGPNTLESEWVRKEITWGIEKGCLCIPIWHDGFTASHLEETLKTYPELNELGEANPIEIKGDRVEDYNNAMTTLVNFFGITPT